MEIKNLNTWEIEREKYLRKNIKDIGIISSLIMLVLLFSIMSMQGQLFDKMIVSSFIFICAIVIVTLKIVNLDDKYSLTKKIASGKITNIDLVKVDKDFATLSILSENGKHTTYSNQFEFIPNIKTAYYDANSGIVKLPIA